MKYIGTAIAAAAIACLSDQATAVEKKLGVTVSHGLTLLETLKYPAGFKHLNYVNPNAPQGGTLRRYTIGSFDTFNPYTIKGSPASGIGLVHEMLRLPPWTKSRPGTA